LGSAASFHDPKFLFTGSKINLLGLGGLGLHSF
jgi:hypothetical protein